MNYIINVIGADIVVLDMPLLDTRQSGDNLDKRFIADLVLQILSYVAQKELENTRCRQKQGMDVMPVINGKKTSLKTGRPNAQFPDNWKDYYEKWRLGEMTATKCMEILNLKRSTFYKLVKIYEKEIYNTYNNRTVACIISCVWRFQDTGCVKKYGRSGSAESESGQSGNI